MQGDIRTQDEGRDHVREIRRDEKDLICHLTVIDYRMRVGAAEVRMAGIAGVHTERQYRMQGHMRRLFEDTVRYMTEKNYDVSMLFGIENFYNKFGYAASLAGYECKVKTRDAEVARAHAQPYTTRPIAPADLPSILDIYNANNATRTGSIIRTPENFPNFSKGTWYGSPPETLLWEDAKGNILAYAAWDKYPKAVKVAEVGARDDAIFPTMLTAFAEQAIEKRCENIQLFLPPDHPFAEYVQRYGAKWSTNYPRYGGGMMRILNQPSLFEKIAPELARRLASTSLARYTGMFDVRTDLGTTTLIFDDGNLTVDSAQADTCLALSQDKLMQLVMGYRSIRDVLNDPDVQVEGDLVPILSALFPKAYAYPWLADHF